MNETSSSSFFQQWSSVIIYVSVIFILTPFLPVLVETTAHFLNMSIQEFTLWLRNIILAAIILSFLAIMISHERYKQQSAYVALMIISVWGAMLVRGFGAPVEATHFLEYGGLSILIFCKLRNNHIKMRSAPLYVAAALLTLGVGVLDEIYQGWLPNRYFDVNDIITNGSSGILGLIYVWGVMRPGSLRQRFHSILKGGHKGAESFA